MVCNIPANSGRLFMFLSGNGIALGIEHSALYMLDKHSATKLYSQLYLFIFTLSSNFVPLASVSQEAGLQVCTYQAQ